MLYTPWHIQGLQTDNGMYLYGATTAMGAESGALSRKATPNPLVTSLQPVPETECLLASSTIRCYPLSNLAQPLHLWFHFHLSYPCFLVSHIKYRRHKKEWITYMRLRLIALSPCYMWISSLTHLVRLPNRQFLNSVGAHCAFVQQPPLQQEVVA